MSRSGSRMIMTGLALFASVGGCSATQMVENRHAKRALPSAPVVEPVSKANAELPHDRAAQVCMVAGAEYEKKGFDEEAIEQFEKARTLDRKQAPRATRRLAVLYDRKG